MSHHIVVGSGPSGVSASLALLRNGHRVTMLDIGGDLSSHLLESIHSLAKLTPDEWTVEDYKLLRPTLKSVARRIPEKTLFGSRMVFQGSDLILGSQGLPNGFVQYPSSSYGGMSRIWGAAAMRLHPSDFLKWPISDLDHYYQLIEKVIPIAASVDGLEKIFGLPLNRHDLSLSSQAREIFKKFENKENELEKMGVTVGKSRLAVSGGCNLCGNCLHGCPYGKIFSSTDLMPILKKFSNFKYINNIRVTTFKDGIKNVGISFYDKNGQTHSLTADRLFLGAGVLSTAHIVLNSLNIRNRQISMMDSQYFLMPFLGPSSEVETTHHTLAQLFMEIKHPEISAYNIHSQIYTYNDLYEGEILAALGVIKNFPGARIFARYLSNHFYIAQSYLHSNESPGAKLELVGGIENPILKIAPNLITKSQLKIIKKVWGLLNAAGKMGGIFGVPFLGRISGVGQGYHSGGTFPLSNRPNNFESDIYGRTYSLKRVHIVDSSVLPSIPSGTITLTVMANAYRIAEQSSHLEID